MYQSSTVSVLRLVLNPKARVRKTFCDLIDYISTNVLADEASVTTSGTVTTVDQVGTGRRVGMVVHRSRENRTVPLCPVSYGSPNQMTLT